MIRSSFVSDRVGVRAVSAQDAVRSAPQAGGDLPIGATPLEHARQVAKEERENPVTLRALRCAMSHRYSGGGCEVLGRFGNYLGKFLGIEGVPCLTGQERRDAAGPGRQCRSVPGGVGS